MYDNTRQQYLLLNRIFKILLTLTDRIIFLCRKIEAIQSRKPESAVMIVYVAAHFWGRGGQLLMAYKD